MTRILTPAIALVLLGATAAQAQTAEVRFADLNLSSQAGQAELDRRVELASRRVCTAEPQSHTRLPDRRAAERCKAEVRAQVAAALHQ